MSIVSEPDTFTGHQLIDDTYLLSTGLTRPYVYAYLILTLTGNDKTPNPNPNIAATCCRAQLPLTPALKSIYPPLFNL